MVYTLEILVERRRNHNDTTPVSRFNVERRKICISCWNYTTWQKSLPVWQAHLEWRLGYEGTPTEHRITIHLMCTVDRCSERRRTAMIWAVYQVVSNKSTYTITERAYGDPTYILPCPLLFINIPLISTNASTCPHWIFPDIRYGVGPASRCGQISSLRRGNTFEVRH